MHLPTILSLFSIAATPLICSASPASYPRDDIKLPAVSNPPFNFTYLFTAHLNLGAPEKPITVPGGVRVVEPILNGTVAGPAINATISPSLAMPTIINNGTLQRPVINAFGTTEDGFPFYLYETGAGTLQAQTTRIELEVGGGSKYAALRNGYILASVHASADRASVEVMGYLVETQDG